MELGGDAQGVELIRLASSQREQSLEAGIERWGGHATGKAQANRHLAMSGDFQLVVRRRLGARVSGIYRIRAAVNHVFVKGILDVFTRVGRAEQALAVGLVLGEQKLGVALRKKVNPAQRFMISQYQTIFEKSERRPFPVAFSHA